MDDKLKQAALDIGTNIKLTEHLVAGLENIDPAKVKALMCEIGDIAASPDCNFVVVRKLALQIMEMLEGGVLLEAIMALMIVTRFTITTGFKGRLKEAEMLPTTLLSFFMLADAFSTLLEDDYKNKTPPNPA